MLFKTPSDNNLLKKRSMPTFVEVGRFYDLSIAELAKSKLQSEEIYCFLHSKYHISLKWYLANALGGIKVFVYNKDADAAHEFLNKDESKLLAEIEFPPPDPDDLCKQCGSEELRKINLNYISACLMILTGLPLIFWGSYYKCRKCGASN